MGILSRHMQRVVSEQRLGFIATVCPDGTPNLSPKGTTMVLDDDHLVFADIRSPGTVANLRLNPSIEINVVDPLLRKGYRFKGVATLFSEGPQFEAALALFASRGIADAAGRVKTVVIVRVERALALVSPVYDSGASEDDVRRRWRDYWAVLERGESALPEEG